MNWGAVPNHLTVVHWKVFPRHFSPDCAPTLRGSDRRCSWSGLDQGAESWTRHVHRKITVNSRTKVVVMCELQPSRHFVLVGLLLFWPCWFQLIYEGAVWSVGGVSIVPANFRWNREPLGVTFPEFPNHPIVSWIPWKVRPVQGRSIASSPLPQTWTGV